MVAAAAAAAAEEDVLSPNETKTSDTIDVAAEGIWGESCCSSGLLTGCDSDRTGAYSPARVLFMETLSVHWGEGFGGKAGGRANKKIFISKTYGGKMEKNV